MKKIEIVVSVHAPLSAHPERSAAKSKGEASRVCPSTSSGRAGRELVLLVILFCGTARAEKTGPPPSPSIHQLPAEAQSEWRKISDFWIHNDFDKTLRHGSFKLNCSGCSSLYLAVELSIDKNGHISDVSVVEQPAAGCKHSVPSHLKRSLQRYLKKLAFPAALRGRTFSARLGSALMC